MPRSWSSCSTSSGTRPFTRTAYMPRTYLAKRRREQSVNKNQKNTRNSKKDIYIYIINKTLKKEAKKEKKRTGSLPSGNPT